MQRYPTHETRLTPKEQCHQDAAEEWHHTIPPGRIALVDPDGDREMLAEFIDWLYEPGDNSRFNGPTGLVVREFLDTFEGDWVQRRTEELEEQRRPDYDDQDE